ncbi:MAG: HAMP domain-containing histidine kinase [Defluviitaleaceae bacterium]|nr:HAMP domain-containing histidine kinase [Defluviitaleaceae bacterium]
MKIKKIKKTKIRVRILRAFCAVLISSFFLTGIIFNLLVRFLSLDIEITTTVIMGIMLVMAIIVTYFLANSLTKPIEKLSRFALDIGKGDFKPNDFNFNEKELQDLNISLNKSARQLAAYDSEQKAFFQNASHELRTPLMSIKCYAEGISFGIMDPKAASETILQETDKLADLVTDLLYISKIDNITTAYKTTETDLVALIKDSAKRQEAMADKNHIKFSFDFGEDNVQCKCVSELMSRAVDNLISNAIRYAKSEIILSCHKKARHIEICVEDDGRGIEPKDINRVFERFYKGEDGVHGIGLSIVKSIVEQQGGNIIVKNSSSGGAMFTISLSV